MTYEDLQDLRDQGYRVETWMAVPEDQIACPKCGRPSEYAQRKFSDNQKTVGLFCVSCNDLREVVLKPQFRATHPDMMEKVTEQGYGSD